MIKFASFTGSVTAINPFWSANVSEMGCNLLISTIDANGNPANFIVTPGTYVVDNEMLAPGDIVTGFYNANAPTPMIYPPQYRALVLAKYKPGRNIKVDFFDHQNVSMDRTLQFHPGSNVVTQLENGQIFMGELANRYLIVIYGATTRSIPAQTTPERIIVLCRNI